MNPKKSFDMYHIWLAPRHILNVPTLIETWTNVHCFLFTGASTYMSPIAYVTLAVCECVHDGHRSIFVVVHAGPSPAEGLGGLNPPLYFKDQFTLSRPGWAHYPHSLVLAPLVLLAPSDFQTLRRPWHVVCVQRRPPPGNLNGLKNMALAI